MICSCLHRYSKASWPTWSCLHLFSVVSKPVQIIFELALPSSSPPSSHQLCHFPHLWSSITNPMLCRKTASQIEPNRCQSPELEDQKNSKMDPLAALAHKNSVWTLYLPLMFANTNHHQGLTSSLTTGTLLFHCWCPLTLPNLLTAAYSRCCCSGS